METGETHPHNDRVVLAGRLAVGLAQGLALYLLYSAMEDHVWPATSGYAFAPMLFLASYIPLLLLLGIGNLRLPTLVIWAIVASAAVASLATYDIWRGDPTAWQSLGHNRWGEAPRILPGLPLWFFTCVGLFIAQALVAGGDADRRFIAHYSTHFDVAWKLGLQLLLAFVFVVIFWCVIFLGTELFNLIGIDYFRRLIEHRWFSIPATTLAQAVAIHLTDVRAGLVRGTRTLVLVLLSWLLPLMAVIAAGFLLSLFSTGLTPLWRTGFAAGYLLIASAVLVFLINAAFQDGDAERRPQAVLRYAGSVASVLLVPLVILSAYAIHLRVDQYGWTTSRVASVACLVIAASYAIGYTIAAFPSGAWLARVARWNFFTALLILAVIAAIFSPVADPTRIAVDSQVARLVAGKISAAKFDFDYLRWHGGRFGHDALVRLSRLSVREHTADIRAKAKTVLAENSQYNEFATPTPLNLATNIDVYPKGRTLPRSFLKQDWTVVEGSLPPCLRVANSKCTAYFLTLGAREYIVVIGDTTVGPYAFGNGLFAQQADGSWKLVGRPSSLWGCAQVAAELQAGRFRVVPPPVSHWQAVEADGVTLEIQDPDALDVHCPK